MDWSGDDGDGSFSSVMKAGEIRVELTGVRLCLCRLCEGGELLDRILSRYVRNHSGRVLRVTLVFPF